MVTSVKTWYEPEMNPSTIIEPTQYFLKTMTYDETGEFLIRENDPRGDYIYTENQYDTTKCLLNSTTAPNGLQTSYTYDPNNDLVTKVSSIVGENEYSVLYGYTNRRLTSITHNGFDYGFTYDGMGRAKDVKIAGETYSTNDYLLTDTTTVTTTYATGEKMRVETDKFDRPAKTTYIDENENSTILSETEYDSLGRVTKSIDNTTETEYNYKYDGFGNITEKTEGVLTSNNVYDSNNRLVEENTVYDDYGWQTARPIYDKNASGKIYPDNEISGMEYDDWLNFEIEKDVYGRVVKKSYSRSNESEFLSISYEYYNNPEETGTRLTNLVKKQITRVKGKAVQAFYYYYDINGNIGTVEHSDYPESIETQDFGVTVENYEYDGMNQLVREDNRFFDETVLCTYDNSGNILTKKEYVHDAETPTELLSQKNYSYPSTGWKDKLTSVNNQPIIYDALGNPLSYLGHNLTWDRVRQLKSFDNNTFSYNSEGIRTKKNDIDYIYHNGKLFIEQRGFDNRIIYYYDESGIAGFTLMSVNYDEYGNFNGLDTSKYVFEKNLQGDVIGIYNDLGRLVAQYRYDAWGNCMITQNVGGMATFNAIRYRGYYYDNETGLYYLKSRYYDPNTGRFINADIYLTSGNILGYNVYAYCLNNPISLCDPSGKTPVSIRDFVESRGGVARCSYYGFAFYELNDIGLVVGDKPFLDYAIDFYIENGVFMAEDYELAYYFKVDDWATYFPGFRWYDGSKGDEAEKGFEVKTIGKFSNKDFCLDFAQCIIDMVGENGKYLGRNAKEIAQECFAHYVLKCLFKIPTSIRSTWFDTYYRSSEEIGYIERDGNSWAYPVLWFLF